MVIKQIERVKRARNGSDVESGAVQQDMPRGQKTSITTDGQYSWQSRTPARRLRLAVINTNLESASRSGKLPKV